MVGIWEVGVRVWQKRPRKLLRWSVSKSWIISKSWIRGFLVIWLLAGVVGALLVIWSRKGYVEKEKTLQMEAWCKQRSRILEEQVKANKYNAKAFSDMIVVFGNSVSKTTFQRFSDSTSYAHPLLLSLMYAVFVDQNGRTGFETQNGLSIMDLSTGGVRSTQVDYLVILYSNSEGQKYVSYDLLSLPDNYDAAVRMRIFTTGMMTEPYHTTQNGKVGIAVLYPVFPSTPNSTTPAGNQTALMGAIFSLFDFETLINNLLMQADDPPSPFVFELFDVTDITQPILVFGESIKLSRGSKGTPIAFAKHVNFSKSDNPLEVNLGDPFRKYMVTCRYLKHQSGWCWGAISWGIVFMALVIIVYYIGWAAVKQMENLRTNYERMEAMKTQAENAHKAKSEFLTTVSHEIRTPMNGVLGMLDFLLDTKLDCEQLEYTKIAQASGSALISLINDVLDMAKVESGHMELEIREFSIRDTLEDVLDVFRARLRESGVEVAALVDEEVPAIMEGDPSRLRQVLVNLMGNALKFTASGHVLLRVCLYRENMMKVNKSGEESSWEESKSTPVSLSPNEAFQSKPFSDVNGRRLSTHSRYKATLSLAKKSVDRMRYSLDSRHDSPLPSTKRERYSSFENVYDTLSGKQAPDDRNSWSRIKQTREMKDCQARESSEDGKSNRSSDRSIDSEKGDDEDTHKRPSVIPTPESLDSAHAGSVKVCIVCEDTGAGIPADARARIFKPFVQAEKSTTRMYGGTGVGLSISQQLVHLMGGKIFLSTQVGVGTTFFFAVTFGLPVKCDINNESKQKSNEADSTSGLHGKRVIVVDGIPLRRMITEIALRRLGMDVLSVSNPQTLADTMSVFYDEGGKPALEKEALLGIFKSWIAPFIKSSFIQNREDWKPPRTSYYLTRENEDFNSEISGANGPADQLDSGPVIPVRTSYQTHLHKNLQRLPSLRLPTDIPPGSSGPSTMRVHHNPTQAERQVVEEFRKGMKCDVILVDKDCFGKGSGVEMGKFLQEVRIKSPTIQPPPMVLLACKLEENEKDVQSLGFGGVLFKPIKPTVMLMLLTEVLKIVSEQNIVGNARDLEKASIRRSLQTLMKGLRVMVVDDNYVNRLVSMKMLRRYGVNVVTAESGQQAIDILKGAAHDIDIIFMDVQMPGMDGFQTTTKIRELEAAGEIVRNEIVMSSMAIQRKRRLVVMAMTADVFSTNSEKIAAGKMDGFITKPIDEHQLYRALKAI